MKPIVHAASDETQYTLCGRAPLSTARASEVATDATCKACLRVWARKSREAREWGRAFEGVPNLDDGLTQKELMLFWKRYSRASRADAERLIGDRRKGFTSIAATLANYACNKAVAMTCRLKGDINAASTYEQHAELCYERLPADLRW